MFGNLIHGHVRILLFQRLVSVRSIIIDIFQLGIRLEPDILFQSFLVIVPVLRKEPEERIIEEVYVCGDGKPVLYALHDILAFLAQSVALDVGSIIIILELRECSNVTACKTSTYNRTIFHNLDLRRHDALFGIELEDGQRKEQDYDDYEIEEVLAGEHSAEEAS